MAIGSVSAGGGSLISLLERAGRRVIAAARSFDRGRVNDAHQGKQSAKVQHIQVVNSHVINTVDTHTLDGAKNEVCSQNRDRGDFFQDVMMGVREKYPEEFSKTKVLASNRMIVMQASEKLPAINRRISTSDIPESLSERVSALPRITRSKSDSSIPSAFVQDQTVKTILDSYQKAIDLVQKGEGGYAALAKMNFQAAKNMDLSDIQRVNHFINGIDDLQKSILSGSDSARITMISALKNGLVSSSDSDSYIIPGNRHESQFWVQVNKFVGHLSGKDLKQQGEYILAVEDQGSSCKALKVAYCITNPTDKNKAIYSSIMNERDITTYYDIRKDKEVSIFDTM